MTKKLAIKANVNLASPILYRTVQLYLYAYMEITHTVVLQIRVQIQHCGGERSIDSTDTIVGTIGTVPLTP